jgi:hypothetical protein
MGVSLYVSGIAIAFTQERGAYLGPKLSCTSRTDFTGDVGKAEKRGCALVEPGCPEADRATKVIAQSDL